MAFVDRKETGLATCIKGFLTGGTQACITYPTEFVKTQLQLQSKSKPEFNGVLDCVKKTVRSHGMAGLYRGSGVRILGAGFQQMFRWAGYANVSYFFRDKKGKISPINNAISGMGAGIIEAVFAVTPIETVKTRVTDDQRKGTQKYKGCGDAIVKILKSESPHGLYRGAVPTILKQATNQAIRMPLQQLFFETLTQGDEKLNKSSFYNGAAGLMAGVASVMLTQPQDCVKSKMQGDEAKRLYNGTVDCFLQMLRYEGPWCFFAGSVPRMIQVGMTTGISFTIYPFISKTLNQVI